MSIWQELRLIWKALNKRYRLGRNRDIPEREFTYEERYKLEKEILSASPERRAEIIRAQAKVTGYKPEGSNNE